MLQGGCNQGEPGPDSIAVVAASPALHHAHVSRSPSRGVTYARARAGAHLLSRGRGRVHAYARSRSCARSLPLQKALQLLLTIVSCYDWSTVASTPAKFAAVSTRRRRTHSSSAAASAACASAAASAAAAATRKISLEGNGDTAARTAPSTAPVITSADGCPATYVQCEGRSVSSSSSAPSQGSAPAHQAQHPRSSLEAVVLGSDSTTG